MGVLLDARAEADHGGVLVDPVVHPPLRGRAGDAGILGDGVAHAVGAEDPAVHAGLLGEDTTGAHLAVHVGGDDLLVGGHGGLHGRVLLGGEPAQVDLGVVQDKTLPGGVGVGGDGDLHREAGLAGDGHGVESFDIGAGLLGRLTDGQATVEAEGELLGHGAVAGGVQLGPGGGAGAVAQELVVLEADALVVLVGGLFQDGAAELQGVLAFPGHGAVAGLALDRDLDLHAAALATVDAQGAVLGAAGAVREDDHIGHHGGSGGGEDVAVEVHGAGAVVVLFADRGVGVHDHALEGTLGLQLQHDLGGDGGRDHTAELIRGAAAEDEVVPLTLGGQVAQLLVEELLVHLGSVDDAVEAVDAAGVLEPLGPQGLHGVRVAVDVDHLLLVRGDAVVGVFDPPHQIAKVVEVGVLFLPHALDRHDLLAEIVDAGELVVGGATEGITTLVHGLFDVVGGDPDGLLQHLCRQGQVFGSQFGDAGIEVGHGGNSGGVKGRRIRRRMAGMGLVGFRPCSSCRAASFP